MEVSVFVNNSVQQPEGERECRLGSRRVARIVRVVGSGGHTSFAPFSFNRGTHKIKMKTEQRELEIKNDEQMIKNKEKGIKNR